MSCYPPAKLRAQLANITYYMQSPYEQVMNMDHLERRHWVEEVSSINQRLNEGTKAQ